MTKRIISIILLTMLVCLSSCTTKTIEISRWEEEKRTVGGISARACDLNLDELMNLYTYYLDLLSSKEPVYFPREGHFTTADGESFISKVGKCSYEYISPVFCTSVTFEVEIYSTDGELIVKDIIGSNAQQAEESVDDGIKKYWDVIKIHSDNLTNNDEGERN